MPIKSCGIALMAVFAMGCLQAQAMEPVSDAALAKVTGRDGITLGIDLPNQVSWSQSLFDRDGAPTTITNAYTGTSVDMSANVAANIAGALVLNGLAVDTSATTSPITLSFDAGQSSAGEALLNVAVAIPQNTKIHVGDIAISVPKGSPPANADYWKLDDTKSSTLLTANAGQGFDITLRASSLNLQLGNTAQSMVVDLVTSRPLAVANLTLKQGVHITKLALPDAADADNAVAIANVYVNDNSAIPSTTSDLSLKGIGMDVTDKGLSMQIGQAGSAGTSNGGFNVQLHGLQLGDPQQHAGLGKVNVNLIGVQLNGAVLTISGH